MTLPYERTNAVNITRNFLMDLINPKVTPRVPRAIRQKALWCLRHYPTDYEMDIISQKENSVDNDNTLQIFGLNEFKQQKEEK